MFSRASNGPSSRRSAPVPYFSATTTTTITSRSSTTASAASAASGARERRRRAQTSPVESFQRSGSGLLEGGLSTASLKSSPAQPMQPVQTVQTVQTVQPTLLPVQPEIAFQRSGSGLVESVVQPYKPVRPVQPVRSGGIGAVVPPSSSPMNPVADPLADPLAAESGLRCPSGVRGGGCDGSDATRDEPRNDRKDERGFTSSSSTSSASSASSSTSVNGFTEVCITLEASFDADQGARFEGNSDFRSLPVIAVLETECRSDGHLVPAHEGRMNLNGFMEKGSFLGFGGARRVEDSAVAYGYEETKRRRDEETKRRVKRNNSVYNFSIQCLVATRRMYTLRGDIL